MRCCLLAIALAVLGCGEPTPAPPAAPDREGDGPTPAGAPSPAAGEFIDVVPGLRYAQRTVAGTSVTAEVFVADLEHVRVVAVDARQREVTAERVGPLRERSGAYVLVNGTFFGRDGAPLGLLHDGDRELNPLRDADWGVLEVADGRARLVHTRDYRPSQGVEFAVQCGPRVVIDGDVPKLRPQSARRTASCVRVDGSVALLVTDAAVEADALGRWLAASGEAGLDCRDALLLDGGPSTQLAARAGSLDRAVAGGWGVPNAIGFAPR
ncbi:MAG: phosphodiester glycosidase family protein [Myxococcota bacterium]